MPSMTSFADGMQRLPDKLADLLGEDRIRFDCAVTGLDREATGWLVTTTDEFFRAANVVVALPLNRSLALLSGMAYPDFQRKLPEALINTVVFGFKGASLPPGFGFLSPEREKRFTLGTLFSSNMFPNRAPEGHIIFETLIGGRRHPERLDYDDDSLIRQALDDVRSLLDLPAQPVYTKVLRPDGGIPQLEKGYTTLLRQRNEIVGSNPGLYVCGFGWEGIGLNDMIKTACSVSEQIIADERQSQDQAEVKKVYF
jgi:oxygen-dependent protoporphyrinogen oxidase